MSFNELSAAQRAMLLTPQEQTVLDYFYSGLSNRQIAAEMTIALTTVKWYARQIYNKLGVSNRREAAAVGRELGLLSSLPSKSTALPGQATVCVGRQAERAALISILTNPYHRLVTIIGPGGIGKTSLTLALRTHGLEDVFTGGLYFLSMDNVTGVQQLIDLVTAALLEKSSPLPVDQLGESIASRRLLLILDGYDHLLPHVQWVITLLRHAPRIKILITSRERLGLKEETLFPLEGLAYPNTVSLALNDPQSYAAIRFWEICARRVNYDYQIENEDLAALVELCRLVEGMPLALELAAAWLDMLPLSQIVSSLKKDIGLLTTKSSHILPLHQHIFAIFETTWKNLTDSEREVFIALSTFSGEFTRLEADQLTGMAVKKYDLWLTISNLIGKSLVRYNPTRDRYSIHALLRQFGAAKRD